MLFKLLGLPFSAPAGGIRFVFDQLIAMAENELLDETRIKEDLLLLQLQLEEGSISDGEFEEAEAEIMARLRAARAYREARAAELAEDDGTADEGAIVIETW